MADLLQPRRAFKVNLIPYNPTDAGYRGSTREAIAAFKGTLRRTACAPPSVSRAAGTSPLLVDSWPRDKIH